MREERTRSLFWPVALILAGAGLLLEQLGLLDVSWSTLWRFWPLLLVLIGLDVLLGRTRLGGFLFTVIAVLTVAATLYLAPIIGPVGKDMTTDRYDLAQGDIRSARIIVEPPLGELTVDSPPLGPNLIEAEITHDPERTEVTWGAERENGTAVIHLSGQLRGWQPGTREDSPSWQVALSPETPIDLTISGGVNAAELDLRQVNLTALDLQLGVGMAAVHLPETGGYRADIGGGIGSLHVYLPQGVKAQITVDGGIGSIDIDRRFMREDDVYRSSGYAPETGVDLRIDGGIGQVRVD